MSPAHRRAAQRALCWGSACARRVREEAQHSTVQALLQALELKDPYTREHSERVGELSALIATELGATTPRVAAVRLGGTLHDIGKLGVPTGVLRKNGPLTAEERHVVQRHPGDGDEVLRGISVLDEARAAVLHHHERLDGTGYPYGLGGARIPEAARIVAVADAFDAMTSTRSYRSARPTRAALAELRRCAGTQFDPLMVDALGRALAATGWRPALPAGSGEAGERRGEREGAAVRAVTAGTSAGTGTAALPGASGTPPPASRTPPAVGGAPLPAGGTPPAGDAPPVRAPLLGATASVEGVLAAAAGLTPLALPGAGGDALPGGRPAGPATGAPPPPTWPLTWAWLDSGAKGKEVG